MVSGTLIRPVEGGKMTPMSREFGNLDRWGGSQIGINELSHRQRGWPGHPQMAKGQFTIIIIIIIIIIWF
jgi:hypothetical protein